MHFVRSRLALLQKFNQAAPLPQLGWAGLGWAGKGYKFVWSIGMKIMRRGRLVVVLLLIVVAAGMVMVPSTAFLAFPSVRSPMLMRNGLAPAAIPHNDLDAALTKRILSSMPAEPQAPGSGGAGTFESLLHADKAWTDLKNTDWEARRERAPPHFLEVTSESLASKPESDVVILGGTLGVVLALALQKRGLQVTVLEKAPLVAGRQQDWNISRKELETMLTEGIMTQEEVDAASIEFNPMRIFFATEDGYDFQTNVTDTLNLGLKPDAVIKAAKEKFEAAGGKLVQGFAASRVLSRPNGVTVRGEHQEVSARLLVDCTGHGSAITRQARWAERPDGVCCVVGSCFDGFEESRNTAGDYLGANKGLISKGDHAVQYFWQAFPSSTGPRCRTAYMFCYTDAAPGQVSLLEMMEDYWKLLPEYQSINLDDVQVRRVLFGFFPQYRKSPMPAPADHVLSMFDASGMHSPISFGGFITMNRHLTRIADGIKEACDTGCLSKNDLTLLNPMQPPNLASEWMYQKGMAVCDLEPKFDPGLIVKFMGNNWLKLSTLPPETMEVFLRDKLQIRPLMQIMGKSTDKDNDLIPAIVSKIGPLEMGRWLAQFLRLASYDLTYRVVGAAMRPVLPRLPKSMQYRWHRRLEQWEYGSGLDGAD
jgi:lycopene cyclase CruP